MLLQAQGLDPVVVAPISIDNLKTKHRLMYLDIKMLIFLKECLYQKLDSENKERSEPNCDDYLNQVVRCYQEFDRMLNGQVIHSNMSRHHEIMDGQIERLCHERLSLIKIIENYVNSLDKSQLVDLLQELKKHHNQIVDDLKKRGSVQEAEVSSWEKKFNQFLIKLSIEASEKCLQNYCGILFSNVARKAEIWSLYLSWEQILKKEGIHLPKQDSVRMALRIKEFLYSTKDAFFVQYFKSLDNKDAVIRKCLEWKKEGITPLTMLGLLHQETQNTKDRVAEAEKSLMLTIGAVSNYGSALIRFFSSCTHIRRASFLVDGQERTLKGNSARYGTFLATPLTGPYLLLSKTLVVGGLLACEMVQWRVMGLSQTLLSSMVHMIIPSTNSLIAGSKWVKVDDKTALQSLPYLTFLFEMTAFVAISGYSAGYQPKLIGLLLSGYLLASTGSYACGKGVDALYRCVYREKPLHEIPSHGLVRGIAQWTVFPLVHGRIFPFIVDQIQFISAKVNVLADKETCLANKELCKREICKVFGLSESAQPQQIRKVFHNYALELHPDKIDAGKGSTEREAFLKIKKVYELFLSLEKL